MARTKLVSRETKLKIIALALKGTPPCEIKRQVADEASIGAIYNILSVARSEGLAIQRFLPKRPKQRLGIVVRVNVWRDDRVRLVERAAAARGKSTAVLINALVDVILRGEISIDAILDDGVVTNATT
jgi:hypothetical protein